MPISKIASPRATGAAGTDYERKIQAFYTLLLLTNGEDALLPNHCIDEICVQTAIHGNKTDDIWIKAKNKHTGTLANIKGQIKRSITLTYSDMEFKDSLSSMWADYTSDFFNKERDFLVIYTPNLSSDSRKGMEWITETASTSNSLDDFNKKLNQKSYSPKSAIQIIKTVEKILVEVASNIDGIQSTVSNVEIFNFLKVFRILILEDISPSVGIVKSLCNTIITQYGNVNTDLVWAAIMDEMNYFNKSAGTINRCTISANILEMFKHKVLSDDVYSQAHGLPQHPKANTLMVLQLIPKGTIDNTKDIETILKLTKLNSADEFLDEITRINQIFPSLIKVEGASWECLEPKVVYNLCGNLLTILKIKTYFSEILPEVLMAGSSFQGSLKFKTGILEGLNNLIKFGIENKWVPVLNDESIKKIASELVAKYTTNILMNNYNPDWLLYLEQLDTYTFLKTVLGLKDSLEKLSLSHRNIFINHLAYSLFDAGCFYKYFGISVNLLVGLFKLDPECNNIQSPLRCLQGLFHPFLLFTETSWIKQKEILNKLLDDNINLVNKLVPLLLDNHSFRPPPNSDRIFRKSISIDFNNSDIQDKFFYYIDKFIEKSKDPIEDKLDTILSLRHPSTLLIDKLDLYVSMHYNALSIGVKIKLMARSLYKTDKLPKFNALVAADPELKLATFFRLDLPICMVHKFDTTPSRNLININGKKEFKKIINIEKNLHNFIAKYSNCFANPEQLGILFAELYLDKKVPKCIKIINFVDLLNNGDNHIEYKIGYAFFNRLSYAIEITKLFADIPSDPLYSKLKQNVLTAFGICSDTLEKVKELGCEDFFWKNVRSINPKKIDLEDFLKNLELILNKLKSNSYFAPILVEILINLTCNQLIDNFSVLSPSIKFVLKQQSYHIPLKNTINIICNPDNGLAIDQILKFELEIYPWMGHFIRPNTTYAKITKNPDTFIDYASKAYTWFYEGKEECYTIYTLLDKMENPIAWQDALIDTKLCQTYTEKINKIEDKQLRMYCNMIIGQSWAKYLISKKLNAAEFKEILNFFVNANNDCIFGGFTSELKFKDSNLDPKSSQENIRNMIENLGYPELAFKV